jgi:hypothetical protein
MSKIYRRPMFRGGGKVSSYGNGIATGLATGGRVGYEMGGNVRGGVVKLPGGYALTANQRALLFDPAKTGSFNQPDTRAQTYGTKFGGATSSPIKTGGNIVENALNNAKTNTSKIKSGLGNIKTNIGKIDFSEKGIGQAFKKLPALGDKLAGYGTNLIKRFPALSYGLASEYVTRPQDVDKVIYEQEGYGPFEGRMRKILDPTYNSKMMDIYKQGYDEDGKLNALLKEQTEKEGQSELTDDQLELKRLREELYNERKGISTEDSSDEYKETLVDKKARLKKTAEGYEELLGEGIKKDSIFDAMIAGGTSLMAGEGYASAIRQANKELDPIQNIKTAARKLALEEDISINKALAVAAAKDTETAKKIRALKKGDYTDREIADALAGKKDKDLPTYIKEAGPAGYMQFVNDKIKPESVVRGVDDVLDVNVSELDDGVHYIADAFALMVIKDKKVVGQPKYLR